MARMTGTDAVTHLPHCSARIVVETVRRDPHGQATPILRCRICGAETDHNR